MARAFPPPGAVIVADKVFAPKRPASHKKKLLAAPGAPKALPRYRIVSTTELDEYEKPKKLSQILAAKKKPAGDSFVGTARRAAKTALSNAPTEKFSSLGSLVKSLVSEKTMASLKPPLKSTATSGRVKQEERNVRLRAFLYAASRESDNDFHLIIGAALDAAKEIYLTIEVSGLPPKTSKQHATLASARKSYKDFFNNNLPGTSYDFYDPPIPVEVEGSLFFDISHAKGGRPGPQSLRPHIPTIWEIHPISRITFEP